MYEQQGFHEFYDSVGEAVRSRPPMRADIMLGVFAAYAAAIIDCAPSTREHLHQLFIDLVEQNLHVRDKEKAQ
jgi:hypothetical protein